MFSQIFRLQTANRRFPLKMTRCFSLSEGANSEKLEIKYALQMYKYAILY